MADKTEANARVGSTIGGKYLLKSVLGVGGVGAVYAAENTWTQRPVALKLLHEDHARSTEVVERFMQEARLASQLRHPNIVDVLDMGREAPDGAPFIVQELLHGNDLRALIDASGRLDVAAAVDIALPLMGALALAHRRGVVHRDIKPENVYLARDEAGEVTPKLIDFGISKIVTESRDTRNLTQAGTLVGTPNYMSPEQARGDAQIDGQTDVWSVGVLLYEMLSGAVPFDAPNQNVLMVKIITEPPRRIETFAPDLPATLATLVHRALARDRAERFEDMPAFIAALLQSGIGGPELFERHRRSLTVSAEISERLQTAALASLAPSADAPVRHDVENDDTPMDWSRKAPGSQPPSRSPRAVLAVAGGFVFALAAVAGGAWIVRHERPTTPAPVAARASEPRAPAPLVTAPTVSAAPDETTALNPTATADAGVEHASSSAARTVTRVRRPVSATPPRTPPARSAPQHAPNANQNGAPILEP